MQGIRNAMLQAESDWVGRAEKAESTTERSVALVVADAFHQEALKYAVTTEHDIDAHYDSAMTALANDQEVTHHEKR